MPPKHRNAACGLLDAVDAAAVFRNGEARAVDLPLARLAAQLHGKLVDLAEARGADAYFTKPFSPLAVMNWVTASLVRAAPASDFTQL